MSFKKNEYRPLSFWSWNGAMKEEEIRWQIREFQKAGFGGFFIHSRAGRTIPYMGKEWFAACQAAVDEAEKCGLDVWLYDEDGWPSGFAGGIVNGTGEAYCGKSLQFGIGHPVSEDARVLAAYRQTGPEQYRRIALTEAADSDLYCYYKLERHYVDIMDRRIAAKFIEVTHEKYREAFAPYFGNVIKGIFTDEPQLTGSPSWSLCMEERYAAEYQQDILDSLWLIYVNGPGYRAFRYRYWQCVNELITDNFAGQIQNWCKENHLIFTGHFSSEDGLIYQTFSNGGVMPLYQNMGMPGIDHLGNRYASPVLMKQVTSVAHQRGLPYVLSESFGCAGWEVSFMELLGIVGWQAVMGVNTFCTHLSAYSMEGRRKRDFPAFYSYQEPWWESCHVLFDAVRKLNAEISSSDRETRLAVLHPIRSVWCECGRDHGEEMRFLTAQFRTLVENLMDLHVDFDLLDEGDMKPERVAEGRISVGQVSYSYLVIPEATTLSAQTVHTLQKLERSGGKLLFVNQRPDSVEGDENHPLAEALRAITATELQNKRGIWQKYFRAFPIQDTYRILDVRMENEVTGIASYYGKTKEGAVLYLFNHQIGHRIETVLAHKGACKIEVLNLTDDKSRDVTDTYDGSCTYARLAIEPQTGVLVRVTDVKEVVPGRRMVVASTEELLPAKIEPTEYNALTIDLGRFCINQESWSELKAVLHMLNEIYDRLAKLREDAKISVEYCFEADLKEPPSALWLAAETRHAETVTVNGKKLEGDEGWWLDKGIRQYDIRDAVRNGDNRIILTYFIPATDKNSFSGEVFETERNRFFYDVEPESIYVRGDFDVVQNGQGYVLGNSTPKHMGNLTAQGMYFYRGNCAYAVNCDYDGVSELSLRLSGMNGIAARVLVGDMYAGMIFDAKERVELTPYLKRGSNRVTIELLGHNRNLLGPHHHVRGKLYFVGPNSFDGTWGFADFVNPDIAVGSSTWTEKYSFVPFGIQQIIIEHRREMLEYETI